MEIVIVREPQTARIAGMVPAGDPSAIDTIASSKCLHSPTAYVGIEYDSEVAIWAEKLFAIELVAGRFHGNIPER